MHNLKHLWSFRKAAEGMIAEAMHPRLSVAADWANQVVMNIVLLLFRQSAMHCNSTIVQKLARGPPDYAMRH